jgi:SAM-dependent methyltransferase
VVTVSSGANAAGAPPAATADPEPIFAIASGFMAAKHLFCAAGIGLFEALGDGPLTLAELAQRTGLPERTAHIPADAMVALGLLERTGDRYANGAVAQTFLAGRTPADLRPYLRFWDRISYVNWLSLEEAVRTGRAVARSLSSDDQRVFSEGVEALTAGPAGALAASYEWDRHERVMDVGGGTGSFLLAVRERHPRLAATLVERPEVAALARRRLAGTPIAVVDGDALADPLPDGHDAVLIANVAHLLSPEDNRRLLERVRAVVPAGARLLLVDFWTDPHRVDPPFAALMAGEFLLFSDDGDVHSEAEVRDWLAATGWRALERRELAGPQSLIVAEAA